MAKFNVTRIAPDGFQHHQAFTEIQSALCYSLAALGHEVSHTFNWLSEQSEINIIFGAELIADFQQLPANSIIFNLEQPSHPNMDKVRRLAEGLIVWDYSRRSTEDWTARGFKAVHVPIGWNQAWTAPTRQFSEDPFDVFFAGWMTPRRTGLIDQIRRAGLKVISSDHAYGSARDYLMSRSKVILNIHHDGRDRFEIIRAAQALSNALCLVTEESSDDDEYLDLHGLYRTPYHSMADLCVTLCRANNERSLSAAEGFRTFSKRDFTATVSRALEAFPLPSPGLSMSTAMQRATSRKANNSLALSTASSIPAADPKVADRFDRACRSGDMADFAPYLRKVGRGNVMEIGVRDGASTSAFLLGVTENGGHLYSVDADDCSHLFPGHPRWTFIHSNSTDFPTVCSRIPYQLDVLLIDGDHSRAGVIADFEYARQLRPGGIVLFHDIRPEERPNGCNDMSWPGDAAREVFEELSQRLAFEGWTSEVIPGKYGLGVLRKPA